MGIFLDKVTGVFDRRFIIAYWSATFLGGAGAVTLFGGVFGFTPEFDWWNALDGTEQALVAGGMLLVTIVAGYILEALTTPVVQLYEGYWREGFLARLACKRQAKRLTALEDRLEEADLQKEKARSQIEQALSDEKMRVRAEQALQKHEGAFASLYHLRHHYFPRDSTLVKPTRLGNVLTAAEEYPQQLYHLDAVLWWPRLVPVLPTDFSTQMDAALTPMLALLNLSLIVTLLALGGGPTALVAGRPWWVSIIIFLGGLLIARAFYITAVNQAVGYGNMVRVAFDLYRLDALKHMHIRLPENLLEEWALWDALNKWIYYYTVPWEKAPAAPASSLAKPFYYDTHQTAPAQSGRKKSQAPAGSASKSPPSDGTSLPDGTS